MRQAWLGAALLSLAACSRERPPAVENPLRVGLNVAPASLDPHERNEFVTFGVLSNVYEGLTALSPSLRVDPALAESWHSLDERTWRFRLRQGVVFHDGRPLTAADVVFSLQRARSLPASEFKSYLAAMESARAVAADEVEIVTQRPNAVLLARLAFVLIVPHDSPVPISAPVGTGPYRLLDSGPGMALRLSAFDRHWSGSPRERAVELDVIKDPDRTQALLDGRTDLLLEVEPGQVEAIRAAGLRVVSSPGPAVDVLGMRTDAPPFRDVRVRRAVSLALDRQALVDRVLLGHGAPAGQLVSRNVFGFDPALAPPARDLTAARRLLAEAGYASGLDVDLETRREREIDELARQLEEAGVRVKPQYHHWHELIDRMARGRVRFAFLSVVSDSGEAGDLFDSTIHTRDTVTGFGDSNESGYSNPALDALIESTGRTARLEERRRILQECMRVTMGDLPLVPVFERNLIWGVGRGIAFEPRADGRVLLRDIRRERPR
ncbi:MAG TPA: ABC transporter substrate-binding protein [Vicinamibacteria bacterium]|nr:ABC transporter substrate-binding protein [Vicinamibacteria bacterium]